MSSIQILCHNTRSPGVVFPAMQAQKRRKIRLACGPCRDRKTRCDGGQPVCKSCETRGMEGKCSYEKGSLRANLPVAEIESRLRRLEQGELPRVMAGNHNQTEQQPKKASALPVETHLSIPPDSPFGASGNSATFNINQTLAGTNLNPETSLHGASSNVAFISLVKDAVNLPAQSSGEKGPNTTDNLGDPEALSTLKMPPTMSFIVLPERQVADALVECFKENIHPVFPVMHWPSFLRSYESLWFPSQKENHTPYNDEFGKAVFHSTVNIIFALGCQYYDRFSPEKSIDLAHEFYERSRKLTAIDCLDTLSISILQMLLLTGVYLKSTRYANRCWNVIGVALRVAQSLGLHQQRNSTQNESQLTREMKRRVWYCCIALDKVTATTFGRPKLLSKPGIGDAPEAIDDEFLQQEGEGQQPCGLPARMACTAYSYGLFDILDDVLSTFYSQNSSVDSNACPNDLRRTSLQSLFDVLTMNSRLDDLVNGIPSHLKMETDLGIYEERLRKCFELQRGVLYCRCLYIRLLMLRPWLLSAIPNDTKPSETPGTYSTPLDHNSSIEIKKLCVFTAQSIVDILCDSLDRPPQKATWHAVYCMFSMFLDKIITLHASFLLAYSDVAVSFAAATVLLAGALCPEISVDLESSVNIVYWNKILKVLSYNKVQLYCTNPSIELLEACRTQILNAKHKGDQNKDQDKQLGHTIPVGPMSGPPVDWTASEDLAFYDLMNFDPLGESWFQDQATTGFDNWP
ncbi:hypothetical protein BP6252_11112 [Coleophoma cylindrospora]|uniref:Zn(2)-C6 fungal-type domain-containing protein n=1 Tax=Coleophoma cylindrospora TaxID=1849047 RepID=A0A3D8QP52_9HELO|nr:hypothetical protein BP6252_11112 [Coleophoma cylindrospora]